MPTRLPIPAPAGPDPTPQLGGAWLAVLVLAAALAGTVDKRASCGPAITPSSPLGPQSSVRTGDAAETVLQDMLGHD